MGSMSRYCTEPSIPASEDFKKSATTSIGIKKQRNKAAEVTKMLTTQGVLADVMSSRGFQKRLAKQTKINDALMI